MRYLNSEEKNTAQMKLINEEEWLQFINHGMINAVDNNIENEEDNDSYEAREIGPIT
jgi:hypothetical protein